MYNKVLRCPGKHDGPEWFIPAEEIEQMDVFLVEGAGGSVDIVVAAQGETDCEQVDEVLGGLEKGLLSPRVLMMHRTLRARVMHIWLSAMSQ